MTRGLISIGLAAAVLAGLPASATGETGDLDYSGCVTGEAASGPAPGGSGACAPAGTVFAGGADSGLHVPESVAVSPDGISAYAVAGEDDALVWFTRNPSTGELTYAACLSGETASLGPRCTGLPGAAPGGADSGMDDPESVTVSPDGISVYVTTRGDDSIVRFNRSPATGSVSFAGCITGELASAGVCTALAPLAGGADSGFDDLKTKEVAISADGRSLYAASELDDAVLRFDRNPFSGALSFEGCITGELASGPAGSDHCAAIPAATAGGANSGLDSVRWVELSPDGKWLYALSQLDDAVARFARDPGTGALSYAGCITAEAGSAAACAPVTGAGPGGADTGLDDPRAIAITANGMSALVASGADAAIASFDRDPATGGLSYRGCLSGETESGPAGSDACSLTSTATPGATGSGLAGLRDIELGPEDRSFHVAAQFDAAVATFDRDPGGGTIRFSGCHTGNSAVTACTALPTATAGGDDSGLADPETVALAADGTSLYANVELDAAIAAFDREALVPPPAPDAIAPETAIVDRPKQNTKKRRARFAFVATESGASFVCSLDNDPFESCSSPTTTKRLRRRRHTFEVSAVDAAGNRDPSPARAKWKVRRKKRGRR